MPVASGHSRRTGIALLQLAEWIPDEKAARVWFESVRWSGGQVLCPRCGEGNVYACKHPCMSHRCRTCKRHFSAKTGTALQSSKVSLKTWVWAIYLETTSLKGVSSMKLHRDLGVSQKTAWFMLQRIREGLAPENTVFEGPAEMDEAYLGRREKNRHEVQKLKAGQGRVGKAPVVGIKRRDTNKITGQVVESTDGETLRGLVEEFVSSDVSLYTDGSTGYKGTGRDHESARHSSGEFVRGQAHTNGVESFWAALKRAYQGVYHHVSKKHLHRYVLQFAGKHNIRDMDTKTQMQHIVAGMVGRRILYSDLIADVDLSAPGIVERATRRTP